MNLEARIARARRSVTLLRLEVPQAVTDDVIQIIESLIEGALATKKQSERLAEWCAVHACGHYHTCPDPLTADERTRLREASSLPKPIGEVDSVPAGQRPSDG